MLIVLLLDLDLTMPLIFPLTSFSFKCFSIVIVSNGQVTYLTVMNKGFYFSNIADFMLSFCFAANECRGSGVFLLVSLTMLTIAYTPLLSVKL